MVKFNEIDVIKISLVGNETYYISKSFKEAVTLIFF